MKKACLMVLVLLLFAFTLSSMNPATSSPTSTGVKIISPTNSTYTPGVILLSVTSTGLAAANIHYSMYYSLDGNERQSIPIFNATDGKTYLVTNSGFATLNILSTGPHTVTVYQEIQTATGTEFDNSTVNFIVNDVISPQPYTSIPSLSTETSPMPTVPEFSVITLFVLLALATLLIISAVLKSKRF